MLVSTPRHAEVWNVVGAMLTSALCVRLLRDFCAAKGLPRRNTSKAREVASWMKVLTFRKSIYEWIFSIFRFSPLRAFPSMATIASSQHIDLNALHTERKKSLIHKKKPNGWVVADDNEEGKRFKISFNRWRFLFVSPNNRMEFKTITFGKGSCSSETTYASWRN